MSLKKFFLLTVMITIVALFYVQMQVTIYDLAYQGKNKEDQATRLADNNKQASLQIAKLKSARSLGHWFSEKSAEIDFVNQGNIVEVKAPAVRSETFRLASAPAKAQGTIGLLTRFFSLKSIAEAQPAH